MPVPIDKQLVSVMSRRGKRGVITTASNWINVTTQTKYWSNRLEKFRFDPRHKFDRLLVSALKILIS